MKRFHIMMATGTVFAVLLITANVVAAPTMRVDGAIINATITPGQVFQHKIVVYSDEGATPMNVVVDVRGLGQALDGAYQELTPDQDNSPLSARGFIASVDNPSFRLQPGKSQEINVTINVPQDIKSGGHYAVIYIHGTPADSSKGVLFLPAVDVPVVLTAGASQDLVSDGNITDCKVDTIQPGQPITVLTTFENTGNVHYKAKNDVSLVDAKGNTVASYSSPVTAVSIIPGYSYEFKSAITDADTSLLAGNYTVVSRVTRDTGSANNGGSQQAAVAPTDQKQIIFKLATDYKSGNRVTISSDQTATVHWDVMLIVMVMIVGGGLLVFFLVRKKRAARQQNM